MADEWFADLEAEYPEGDNDPVVVIWRTPEVAASAWSETPTEGRQPSALGVAVQPKGASRDC